ncbi:dynein axonemal heavy chain 12-like [Hypomesus transpacificus]|uniref:dynein axonemal heavy chain 12-like n=1 Tax=Hypomesus transpacificus TaxID=137520 RepID=UPI001F080124|nr:dynein axonemal heavy chain 12-like [Hypomesus transpacificus]
MDFDLLEMDGDEDADTQYMIEQSLLECTKQSEHQDRHPEDGCRATHNTTEYVKVLDAIRKGDEAALRELSACQSAFSETDSRGWIPLHEAATQKNQTILEVTFAASGQSAGQCRTPRGKSALHLAVEQGLLENAAFLLQKGCSLDCQDDEEDSPLVIAIRNNREDLAKLLLCSGCHVNQEGNHCRTPLHEAARLGLLSLVKLLLKAGAEPDARSAYGLSPLALAAQNGHLDVVQALIHKGVNVQSQAQDSATILFEASASGNPEIISLLLEYGADANIPKHTGHLPIHRVSHRGHLEALKLLIPVTTMEAVDDSGMSPLHSAADGGHTPCLRALLGAGFDPNDMLHPWVRRNYDDQRKSALFFAVSNNDVPSVRMLLEAGAMPNQDPVKCLQVALRHGNYELMNLLLRFGANVNYFSRINTTHFPSALQYALKDDIILRMLCNYGYDVQRCFDCPYGEASHVPDDYEGWSNTVIKDTMFCEVITVYWLKDISGHMVRIMLDYVSHVTFCSKLKAALMEQKQWLDICKIQENVRCLQHLCRLKIRSCLGRLRLRAPVFMSFLSLPNRLKDYILFQEYDLYSQSQGIKAGHCWATD